MGKSKFKRMVAILVVVGIPLLLIAGGVGYGVWAYSNQKKALIQKIKELPPFDERESVKNLALELNFPTPINSDELLKKIEDEGVEAHYTGLTAKINKQIRKKIKTAVKKRFPIKKIAKDHLAIVMKYDYAQPGDTVKFQIKDRRLTFVTGKFIKVESEGSTGRRIYLEVNKLPVEYSLNKILEDHYYLFSKTDSKATIARRTKEYDDALAIKKEAFKKELQGKLEQQFFKSQGYEKRNGTWVHRLVTLKHKFIDSKDDFAVARQREIKKLIEDNKFFGMVAFEIEKGALHND